MADAVSRSAPEAFDSVTVNVSSLSFSMSSSIEIEIVLLVVPAGLLVSWTGLSSLLQMAPVVVQVRWPGSVTVTASLPSGSTVISQLSLCPSLRWARVTSPLVTVNAWSRMSA